MRLEELKMHLWDQMKKVNELLSDDLSRKIYEYKIEWLFNDKRDMTLDLVYEMYDTSRIFTLENFVRSGFKEVAVTGCGERGQKTLKALLHAGYTVKYFIDNDIRKQGKCIQDVPIISFSDFVLANEDVVAVIDNKKYEMIFYNQLIELGYDYHKIYLDGNDGIRSYFGNIYFDLPYLTHSEDEVFIDAGCFSGETTLEFIKWCGGKYNRIYAFEPVSDCYKLCKKTLGEFKDVELIETALGKMDCVEGFVKTDSVRGGGFAKNIQHEKKDIFEIKTRSLDSVLNGNKVTFIKMDIEGAELDALEGARQTISKYKPKLAISLYHKKEDILTIPLYLAEIRPDYKFYLRCYTNKRWDFVLYAV